MRTALVTGATSGIGLEIARCLLEAGYLVIGTGRDREKCEAVEAQFKKQFENVIYLKCDNSSLKQVKGLAEEVYAILSDKGLFLDVLINNAGCYTSRRIITEDGLEMQFGVNYVSAFLLTRLLLPLLLKSPNGRVISVSSKSHYSTRLNLKRLNGGFPYIGFFAYKRSKLALAMMTHELNRRFASPSFCALTADPGLVNTEIGCKSARWLSRLVWNNRKRHGVSPRYTAENIVYLATENIYPKEYSYYLERKEKRPSETSLDAEKCRRLFDITEEICKSYLT